MLDQLEWASLQERQAQAKVEMMLRIVNGLVDIPTSFLTPTLMMRRALARTRHARHFDG